MSSSYAVVLAVALGATLIATPIVRWGSVRLGAVVQPSTDARHVHTRPVPTLGGAAMFIGFLVAMAVASQLHEFKDIFEQSSEPFGLLLGAGVMFVVGAL